MSEPLLHYSHQPLGELVSTSQVKGQGEREPWLKPHGLWLSVGEAWKEWCEAEDFNVDRLAHVSEVILRADANMALIDSKAALEAFNTRYSHRPFPGLEFAYMDWAQVAADHQGLLVAPYLWECRFDTDRHASLWYYAMDCASGCIWDVSAVASVRQL